MTRSHAFPVWCFGLGNMARICASLIRHLPVVDASPMLFRMGPSAHSVFGDFTVPLCQNSIGVSMDELPAKVPRGRRLFFFYPGKWTPSAYDAALAQARRWQ